MREIIDIISGILNFIRRLFVALFRTLGYIFEALSSSDKQPNRVRKYEREYYNEDEEEDDDEEGEKTYIDENGYRRFTDSDIAVHRWVAEKKIGRKLKRGEVVHHRNRNKLDNSPGNLQVFPNQEAHDEQHRKDEEKYGFAFSYMGKRRKKYE